VLRVGLSRRRLVAAAFITQYGFSIRIETSAMQPYARRATAASSAIGDRTSVVRLTAGVSVRHPTQTAEKLKKKDKRFMYASALMPGRHLEANGVTT